MRLSKVMEGLPVCDSPPAPPRGRPSVSPCQGLVEGGDLEISGICHDSRRAEPGDLFVAWQGERHDGGVFARQAVEKGAVAILASGLAPEEIGVPWLLTREPRALLGPMAARVYGQPDRELVLVGVTGTNGKSTVTTLLAAILEAAGRSSGRLGTLGYVFGGRDFPGERTTPEASDLFRTLRQMRDRGADAVVMEVSSHALSMGRVEGAGFDVGVFTNLSRDHFDFHRGFEDYFACKRRLFDQLKGSGRAVVNVEDAYGRRLQEELDDPVSFGEGGAVRVADVELDPQGIRGRLETPRGGFTFRTGLLGDYNVGNLLAAAAAAEALGLPHRAVAQALAGQHPLPGRMEPVEWGQPFPVIIDYAHTDAALEAALRSLRGFSGCKIVCVFGCGGDRDPGKRPLMGRVAGEGAELPILTSDNPRSEDPLAIIAAVKQGLQQSGRREFRVIPDRREAIRRALSVAGPGWAVLVAGKGHERVQIIGEDEVPFSDREEVEAALEERFGSTARG